ncbi:MAG TPA: YfiR family protein [Rhizomicrobium sp.]|nr:YfiR family protein [Rhizomicrobium sp.]
MGDGGVTAAMKRCLRVPHCALALFAILAGGPDAHAQGSLEYAVKGAFLYKFLPFVEWPPSVFPAPNSPIAICILGNDPFGPALDKVVSEQRIAGHPLALHHLPVGADAASCQAVFIGISDPRIEADAVHALDGKPVLTITDSGAADGGVISFVVEQNHVRFDIDDAAAAHDGLVISSKLLDLARKVTPRKAAP